MLHLNTSDQSRPAFLFEVTGDREQFRERLDGSEWVRHYDIAPIDERRFFLHLQAEARSIAREVFAAMTWESVIVVPPITYRDGCVYGGILGDPADLQGTLDALPDLSNARVEEVSSVVPTPGSLASKLSDRQREALQAASALGYYENPRRATQADVAERLGCAPSTAGEHLRKAEAKLVDAVVAEFSR